MGGALLEGWVSFSDLAQGPIDGFFHEVAGVGCAVVERGEEWNEVGIGRFFVVDGECGHEDVAGAAGVFGFFAVPLSGLCVGVRGVAEEVDAELVAEVPGVYVGDPGFHLCGGDEAGVVYHGGEEARFVDVGLPEGARGFVLAAEGAGEFAKGGDGNAESGAGVDSETRHAFAVGRVCVTAQLAQNIFNRVHLRGESNWNFADDPLRSACRGEIKCYIKVRFENYTKKICTA